MAALTWDAMFKSRRAAIVADGGGGGLFDSVAVWRPAEVGCSVPLLTVVITRVCRKSGVSSVFRKNNLWLFIEKRLTIWWAPGLFKLNKINNPRSKC